MYVTTNDVYATAGIDNTVIPETNINLFIQAAEDEVDRLTNTTYWAIEDSGTTTSSTSVTLNDTTKAWTVDEYTNEYLWIYAGTGSGQIREIVSNTSTQLTISKAWDTILDTTSIYRIIHSGNPAYKEELRDGNTTATMFTFKYPLRLLESATIDSTNINVSNIYQYKDTGKLMLNRTAAKTRWSSKDPQSNQINYWWGVFPLPGIIKRYVTICASLKALMSQAGGTYNVPSTYSLPEGSLTIGQAYINIRGAWDMLSKEKIEIEKHLVKYPSFADDPNISGQANTFAGNYWY